MAKKDINHGERAHALLSASGADRWLNCTPSPVLEQSVGSTTSSYAEEGTLAHEFGDILLQYRYGLISKKVYLKKYTELSDNKYYSKEMDGYVLEYVDQVFEFFAEAKAKTNGAILSIEDKVDLTEYIPDGFGTCDANIIADKVLYVNDLKYGKGVRVDADNNSQLKLYGLGALRLHELSYDIETVRLTIIQPRLNHVSTWDIDAEALRIWGELEVKPKAKIAFAGKGEQVAGDWCRWCKVKARCRALAENNLELAKLDFKKPPLLDAVEIIHAYEQAAKLTLWMNSISKHVLSEALKGKNWPGYKLVEGRSNRKWLDADLVQDTLLKEGYTQAEISDTKVKGIGAISSLMTKDGFADLLDDLIIKPPGKPTLVKDSDKRRPYNETSVESDFKDEKII